MPKYCGNSALKTPSETNHPTPPPEKSLLARYFIVHVHLRYINNCNDPRRFFSRPFWK